MSRFVHQTRFHDPPHSRGNCTEAALATLLGVPLETIGDFPQGDPLAFWTAFEGAAERFGFEVILFDREMAFDSLYLASGPTVRSATVKHMVVMQKGQLFHDPHPSRAGLTKVEMCRLLVPLDPSKHLRVMDQLRYAPRAPEAAMDEEPELLL